MSNLKKLIIDGIEVEVDPAMTIIQAAEVAGVEIPRFCYHERLTIAGNCRMCLVQVEKAPKPLPACATPVTNGMKVFTHSELAVSAQKGVMEFLLINHPIAQFVIRQANVICRIRPWPSGWISAATASQSGRRKIWIWDPWLRPR